MTRNAVPSRVVYQGSGDTSVFNVAVDGEYIYFRANADIDIYERASNGVISLLVETTDYTLTGAPTGGVVTLAHGNLASGVDLAILRASALSQESDFELTGDWEASRDTITDTFDRLIEIIQEVDDKAGRALKLDVFDVAYDAGSKKISNVTDPTSAQDVATKAYVDMRIAAL